MIRILLLLLFLLGPSPILLAQFSLPLPEAAVAPQPEASVPLQDLDAERTRVEAHIAEATGQLTQAQQALGAPDPQRTREDEEALQERVNQLQTRIQVGRRHLKVIADAQLIREEKRQLQEEVNGWTGFADPPPYPLDLVEEIARKLKSQQGAIKSDELRLASSARGKALTAEQLASAEKELRRTLEALEAAGTDEAKVQARRRHALSQVAASAAGEGAAYVRAREQVLAERLSLDRLGEAFSQKRLSTALRDLRLTPNEVQPRQDALGEALNAANASLAKITASEDETERRIAEVRGRREDGNPAGAMAPLLTLELQLGQAQLDAIRATMDEINLRIGYLHLNQTVWRDRLELHQHWGFTQAKNQLGEIDGVLKIVDEGISKLELARAECEAFAVERRFEVPELDDARNALIAAVRERNTQLAQTLPSARQLRDLLLSWKGEIEVRAGNLGVGQEVRGWGEVLVEYLKRLWSFEVLSVEDTLVVDGERLVERRPVTIGKVIEALLILGIGLLVAAGLARLISRLLLPFAADKWHSRLLVQKILRVGMIVLVVVLALITVKIPLSVFAFLGGAMALGIAFGAKNLINNFISGFMLLGEGTIRVGDRIEIEGTGGIVEAIGDRATRVRRFDGVDIVIPNSEFLESRVTNMTLSDRRMRTNIQVGVAYGSPTRQVQQLLLDIAKSHELVVADPAPVVVFEDFGDSALIFRLFVWIDFAAQQDYRTVVTELRHRITERFADLGYEMAFPQRDLHLDAKDPLRIQVLPRSTAGGAGPGAARGP